MDKKETLVIGFIFLYLIASNIVFIIGIVRKVILKKKMSWKELTRISLLWLPIIIFDFFKLVKQWVKYQ